MGNIPTDRKITMFNLYILIGKLFLLHLIWIRLTNAVTMEQFDQSLDMMRNGCAPKFKNSLETLDNIRFGRFEQLDESSSDVKCYTKCIAQLAGTLTKKGEFSISKATAQIPIILPKELQEVAKEALNSCKDVQKDYKDPCDRVFYTTKCVYHYRPSVYKFP
ncbi:general odorant-binding protein lush [Musca vetustissima]|uniref:general odorant-binding protein lush n=1 Tax=Musca vetustissima TaxID=27455 RepID=UPI002AB71239|nr:general odorant-binding protein lush [Musca vetustissima]